MPRLFATLLAVCALLGAGCASRPATAPLATLADASACPARTDTLLVMLPGAYSSLDEFAREGFIDAVRQRGIAADVLRADAHLGYYDARGSVVRRLHEDVVVPARARGYRSIWIVGISVGGLGGMLYARERPGELAGLVVIAPYLGERATATEIDNAGGLARWQAPTGPLDLAQRESRDPALWRWLQGYAARPAAPDRPALYLGYGTSDRFAFSHRLLAAALPGERVATTAGGHDWPEWRRLWHGLLTTLPLPRCD
jgi:pimeloyl-ACP methyl ester carboxylesterase